MQNSSLPHLPIIHSVVARSSHLVIVNDVNEVMQAFIKTLN
jgi:hypothetical protein